VYQKASQSLRPRAQKILNPLFPAAGTSGKALYSPQVWNFRVSRRENYARGGLHLFIKEGSSSLL